MSENTRSSAFRKIDVDQFNENFKEDEQPENQSTTAIPDESEITTMINQYPLLYLILCRISFLFYYVIMTYWKK